jgi:hypothetical protein
MSNLMLLEAYVQYCYSRKHTVGEQLLDVRRDKREWEDFSNAQEREDGQAEKNGYDEDEIVSITEGKGTASPNICPHCGVRTSGVAGPSHKETLLGIAGVLMLLMMMWRIAEPWMKQQEFRVVDHMA